MEPPPAAAEGERALRAPRAARDRAVTAAELGRKSEVIINLSEILGVDDMALLTTCSRVFVLGSATRHDGRRHVVRANGSFYGHPHYSWLDYVTKAGEERIGRARVLITGINGDVFRAVVVERAEYAAPEPLFPLTAYGCRRLRWVTRPDGTPDLKVVLQSAIVRVLCVELDWGD